MKKLKSKIFARVISNEEIANDIFSMWVEVGEMAENAHAGEFVSLYTADNSRLLPRPISICEINKRNKRLRLVYRIAGLGTGEFSRLTAGSTIGIIGTLGNGFPVDKTGERVLLFGGGIGIPPLLEVAKALNFMGKTVISILGFRNSDTFLVDEFKKYSEVIIATDDGSLGVRGTVIDAVQISSLSGITDVFACGPKPMLKGVKDYGESKNIPTYLSLEERMACGIGVCLGCVCSSSTVDTHSFVKNKRICKDGPVFLSTEVVI